MEDQTIKREVLHQGKIFSLLRDEIKLPNGKTAIREYISREGAAAIVAADDQGKIFFVRQYRHPVKQSALELPAGTLEKGEDPKECAMRELEEEIGWKAQDLELLTSMYTSIGVSSEVLDLYLAKGLTKGTQNLDPDEFIEIEKYTLDEALEMIKKGEIKDAKTIVGVYMYKERLSIGL